MSNKATGSEGFKMAGVDLDERSKGMDARMVHMMHGEIIVEAKTEIVKALKRS
ncbi:MAG: hypothetical protein ABSB22_01980 [Thermodesulfobacteriota bacterium]